MLTPQVKMVTGDIICVERLKVYIDMQHCDLLSDSRDLKKKKRGCVSGIYFSLFFGLKTCRSLYLFFTALQANTRAYRFYMKSS